MTIKYDSCQNIFNLSIKKNEKTPYQAGIAVYTLIASARITNV